MNKTNNWKTRPHKTGFLFYVQRLLSWFWPIRLDSAINGESNLELIIYRGVVQLNSGEANYSRGNLQTAFQLCFEENKSDINWATIHEVLVLGLGLGGVCDLIKKYAGEVKITGVEKSHDIIKWYRTYYSDPNLKVIETDAVDFVKSDLNTYDLIIVDLYDELDVPEIFQSVELVSRYFDLLNSGGELIFNKVVANENHRQQYSELMIHLSHYFKKVRVNEQMEINRFLIVKKS
ncbi:MAG: hypothetical protein GC181_00150 [Bacteroidetes bacterium]|nr:hypothetical protein [Bacteroidota bacterium]